MGSLLTDLETSAWTKGQGLVEKILGDKEETPATQQALSAGLDTPKKDELAQSAARTQAVLFGITALLVVGSAVYFIVKYRKK